METGEVRVYPLSSFAPRFFGNGMNGNARFGKTKSGVSYLNSLKNPKAFRSVLTQANPLQTPLPEDTCLHQIGRFRKIQQRIQ